MLFQQKQSCVGGLERRREGRREEAQHGGGGGYPEERKDQEGVSGRGSKTGGEAWPGEKGSLLFLQW